MRYFINTSFAFEKSYKDEAKNMKLKVKITELKVIAE